MIELLAPAGDLQRFKIAIEYGADAVYLGGKQFSLRARASNFTLDDIKEAVQYAHQRGKRVHVTVNMIPHNSDFEGLEQYLRTLGEIGVDAIICASKAILLLSKKAAPGMEVHVSTQQTTINTAAVKYWQNSGADRVVLAREVTLENMKAIRQQTDFPLEVFIHGGMCANYSGRCTISNMLTNRDANRGGCAQSCRWNYHLYHEQELLDRDDYLLSLGSKDMCAADYIEDICKLDVASVKIEGRMKTAYYIANVVKGYRYLIDCFQENGCINDEQLAYGRSLIDRVANRQTFPGFYPGLPQIEGQLYNTTTVISQDYVASVLDYQDGIVTALDRNYFQKGDRLAVMNPQGKDVSFILEEMADEKGEEVLVANKPMQVLKFKVPTEVSRFSFIKLAREGQP